MLRNIKTDETADSYTWLALCAVIIVMTGVYLGYALVINEVTSEYDYLIDRDMATDQNLDCFNFNISLFNALPVIMLFLLSIWAIIHTMRSKEGGL